MPRKKLPKRTARKETVELEDPLAEFLEPGNELDTENIMEEEPEQPVPPRPGERVMRREQLADGTEDVQYPTGNIMRVNPLSLLEPKDPHYKYRWVNKNQRADALKATGWEFVKAKSSMLDGIEGRPVDDIAQLHDLVCMRIPKHIWEKRQEAVKARGLKARKKAAEELRRRMQASGERIFGTGVQRRYGW